jgi:hypothetical protein
MTAKAIEVSSAMLVTSIAVAIISTTTPDHAGVRAARTRSKISSSSGSATSTSKSASRTQLARLRDLYVLGDLTKNQDVF